MTWNVVLDSIPNAVSCIGVTCRLNTIFLGHYHGSLSEIVASSSSSTTPSPSPILYQGHGHITHIVSWETSSTSVLDAQGYCCVYVYDDTSDGSWIEVDGIEFGEPVVGLVYVRPWELVAVTMVSKKVVGWGVGGGGGGPRWSVQLNASPLALVSHLSTTPFVTVFLSDGTTRVIHAVDGTTTTTRSTDHPLLLSHNDCLHLVAQCRNSTLLFFPQQQQQRQLVVVVQKGEEDAERVFVSLPPLSHDDGVVMDVSECLFAVHQQQQQQILVLLHDQKRNTLLSRYI
eukprot:PhF_6_TR31104/c0_g1_i5/m.45500